MRTLYTRSPSVALIKRAQKISDRLAREAESFPQGIKGRGIVICGGGYTYYTNAYITIRMLRHLGCQLPIQLWHLGSSEVSERMKRILSPHGVECVDGLPIIQRNSSHTNAQVKAGWVLKSVALARCPFEEVIFLDSDNLPLRNPEFLFELSQYKTTGALFWPDSSVFAAKALWRVFRTPARAEPEFESGQLVVDKRVNWEALVLAEKINFHADTFYRLMWGDKDTFRFAWHKLGRTFSMPKHPPQVLRAAGFEGEMLCQHDFQGVRLFQHRIMYKWNLIGENPWVSGFFFENECREFLDDLKSLWDGRCNAPFLEPQTPVTSAAKNVLLNTTWLLELPRSAEKKHLKRKRRKIFRNLPKWIEVGFNQNGTLGKSACDKIGYFWDLKQREENVHLALSSSKNLTLRLTLKGTMWKGRWNDSLNSGPTKMVALDEVYPHLKPSPSELSPETISRTIRSKFRDEIHVVNAANGIGDHIASVYACAALARTGVRVVFHTPHAEWLERVVELGLVISDEPFRYCDHNLDYDYENQLKYGVSKRAWYAGGLHPLLKPVAPKLDIGKNKKRLPFDRYILLAPFAAHATRDWADIHWNRLAHLLREAGYEVVAIGSQENEERLQKVFGSTQAYWVTNHPPAWVIDALLGATAYIGMDSGMTHLAALIGAKALAIHAHLNPEFLWPLNTVKSISPNTKCAFCRWQPDGGWNVSCHTACSALVSIKPETVLSAALALIKSSVAPTNPGENLSELKQTHLIAH